MNLDGRIAHLSRSCVAKGGAGADRDALPYSRGRVVAAPAMNGAGYAGGSRGATVACIAHRIRELAHCNGRDAARAGGSRHRTKRTASKFSIYQSKSGVVSYAPTRAHNATRCS